MEKPETGPSGNICKNCGTVLDDDSLFCTECMPCKVKVTCLETGKSTVVRINNRGPFHSNRLIDLTTAAASRIGLHRRGVSRVRLEVISVGDGPHEVSAR